jgi:hypothetical protein
MTTPETSNTLSEALSSQPKLPDFPAIPSDTPLGLKRFLEPLREYIQIIAGRRGSTLDTAVTFRDLVKTGVVELAPGAVSLRDGAPSIIAPSNEQELNLSSPPAPTGVTATGGYETVFVSWNVLVYRDFSYAEVFRAETNNVSVAVKVGQTDFTTYVDRPGLNVTRYYWVRFVSQAGIVGPFHGANGVSATTAIDVSSTLTALTGQITENQLFSTLGSRINLIDGPISLAGSVNARVNTVQLATNNNTTAIQTETSARISADGVIEAKNTVKIDTNGYVTGYGLIQTANNATPTSEFAVRADRFLIASPSGPGIAPVTPFVVQTTPTTVNGVSVPVGVYIDSAYIQNGTITNAKIGSAAIDNAKISSLDATKITSGFISADRISAGSLDAKIANIDAAKITSGFIDTARINDGTIVNAKIGNIIQSNNYVAGSSGWKIDKGGAAELQNATVRGNITATSGQIGGFFINPDQVYAGTLAQRFIVNASGGVYSTALEDKYDVDILSSGQAYFSRGNVALPKKRSQHSFTFPAGTSLSNWTASTIGPLAGVPYYATPMAKFIFIDSFNSANFVNPNSRDSWPCYVVRTATTFEFPSFQNSSDPLWNTNYYYAGCEAVLVNAEELSPAYAKPAINPAPVHTEHVIILKPFVWVTNPNLKLTVTFKSVVVYVYLV